MKKALQLFIQIYDRSTSNHALVTSIMRHEDFIDRSAVTLINEQFAQKDNFEVSTGVDCVLRGSFGNSCKPTGVTQARITIGDACATVEDKVIKNLPYEVMGLLFAVVGQLSSASSDGLPTTVTEDSGVCSGTPLSSFSAHHSPFFQGFGWFAAKSGLYGVRRPATWCNIG
ncbi:hypothetical protein MRX96_004695 [Rhipicephalus microplus]